MTWFTKTRKEPSRWRLGVLWVLLFIICFTLGYPTLNRYDPRNTGNVHAAQYYKLVLGSPKDAVGHWRYRILVPYLAKPFQCIAAGRVGTWDPVFFGLLLVNSALCATSACILMSLGQRVLTDYAVALVGGFLYLLNFAVVNGQLAGLVDSAEGCLMLATTWALASGQWILLPLLGVVGTLAKETFLPLATAFVAVWWLVSWREGRAQTRQVVWVFAVLVAGLATMVFLQSGVSREWTWPWEVMLAERHSTSLIAGLLNCMSSRSLRFVLIWLLPLGIWRLKCLPRAWVFSSLAAGLVALMIGAWKNAGGNVGWAIFNTAGPALSLSAAVLIPPGEYEFSRGD